jgi:hypothetical protein
MSGYVSYLSECRFGVVSRGIVQKRAVEQTTQDLRKLKLQNIGQLRIQKNIEGL